MELGQIVANGASSGWQLLLPTGTKGYSLVPVAIEPVLKVPPCGHQPWPHVAWGHQPFSISYYYQPV